MTNQIRTKTLQPMGRGILDSDPTCTAARQESLRTWAAARRGASDAAPATAAVALAKRASSPRR
jgi:hypothetical protein